MKEFIQTTILEKVSFIDVTNSLVEGFRLKVRFPHLITGSGLDADPDIDEDEGDLGSLGRENKSESGPNSQLDFWKGVQRGVEPASTDPLLAVVRGAKNARRNIKERNGSFLVAQDYIPLARRRYETVQDVVGKEVDMDIAEGDMLERVQFDGRSEYSFNIESLLKMKAPEEPGTAFTLIDGSENESLALKKVLKALGFSSNKFGILFRHSESGLTKRATGIKKMKEIIASDTYPYKFALPQGTEWLGDQQVFESVMMQVTCNTVRMSHLFSSSFLITFCVTGHVCRLGKERPNCCVERCAAVRY